ncbi:uncharacterized protein SPPG_07807 [Spizellomyces punctatus DAOM BR117]|uniref:Condensation domain-containing protein n=1 Tax=Spizellomyces punctatus (strain DAOM BR117) TaxID=645134 RepID=A0A0L0H655_SPIPD|nr:uncharacterized protein SPPG_07807 [Spizellomyces punctatus DAOM BR117]KNC96990.1 hypothetical protein SPPG_07807 [Spizellomyces punctatus DAOM BR117]|eukprot:XP_016605030.1 hypothetical protein SPPG_07807 [Spizellomyces punctatus DAOM BR117]
MLVRHSFGDRPFTNCNMSKQGPLKRKSKGVLPDNALSITERIFYQSAPGRPQVIMSFLLRLHLPPQTPDVSIPRLVDLLKLAASEHYRLTSFVDPTTLTVRPLGETAADFKPEYRVVAREDHDTWRNVFCDEMNINFDTNDVTKPLWRTVIIAHKSVANGQDVAPLKAIDSAVGLNDSALTVPSGEGETETGSSSPNSSHTVPSAVESTDTLIPAQLGPNKIDTSPLTYSSHRLEDKRHFEIIFSFHHCLGDGLSMYAFAKTFLAVCDADHLNASDLRLETVALVTEPPPLIDNLFNPYLVQVLPVAASMAVSFATSKGRSRFKGRKVDRITDNTASQASSSDPITLNSTDAETALKQESRPTLTRPLTLPIPRPLLNTSQTNARFLWFDSVFTESLRKRAKREKTSIAAVLVVAAMAAVRSAFETIPKYSQDPSKRCRKRLPTHQGWVVTSTIRYLLPGSRLLQGGDRATDPAMQIFGGYSGSVMNSAHRCTDSDTFWGRVRSVRRRIAQSQRSSVARLQLVNWCFRHKSLWKRINESTDLSKLSRSYSVEVANLGAWDYPIASPRHKSQDDPRAVLSHFAGLVNSSFDGVRGLFTLGVITLGGDMSVGVGYDKHSVSEADADAFVTAFERCMRKLVLDDNGQKSRVTVGELRKS